MSFSSPVSRLLGPLLESPAEVDSLQVLVVLIFLWHGVPKAFDPSAAAAKFEGWGLPGILGPITGWVELVVAPLLFVRVAHRAAVAVLLAVILGAIATVQIPGGITSGLERDLLLTTVLVLLAVTGPGRLALGRESAVATTAGRQ